MKTKNLKYLFCGVLAMSLLTIQGGSLYAQSTEKKTEKEVKEMKSEKKEVSKVKKDKESDKSEKAQMAEKDKKTLKDGEKNAYGKNKGELSGKEFGKDRAAQAKLNGDKKEQLNNSVSVGEKKVKAYRDRIKASKKKLEKDKKTKKISDAEYKTRKQKIDQAESAVDNLDQKIKKGKKLTKENIEKDKTEIPEK